MKENRTTTLSSIHTGDLFQTLRHNADLSQEEAAEKLECATRTIQRYEAGDTTPDYFTLCRMPDCYNYEVADLFPRLAPSRKETEGNGNVNAVVHSLIDPQEQRSFRIPMRVSAIRCFWDTTYGRVVYSVCPRCNSSLERDFQNYCSCCGQALDWKYYSQTLIILPDSHS